MTKIRRQQYKMRNPEARKLHEERAFKLKVRSDKRVPHVEEVTVRGATIIMEEEKDEDI